MAMPDARKANEVCKRLHEALCAVELGLQPPVVAAIFTADGALVDQVVPPLLSTAQAERLCKILEKEAQR
ncbi:hypothetical protein ACFC0M_09580 [Streptomyces sp. NPDC056149]|uniref:hypothetical protein n=1 Tax=Streptomyces sp. NPDC056149 TaxID=3345728 RepID=UPI0035E1343E